MDSQFFILHLSMDTDLPISGALHPRHLFFSRKKAMQTEQFMPQGAMREARVDMEWKAFLSK